MSDKLIYMANEFMADIDPCEPSAWEIQASKVIKDLISALKKRDKDTSAAIKGLERAQAAISQNISALAWLSELKQPTEQHLIVFANDGTSKLSSVYDDLSKAISTIREVEKDEKIEDIHTDIIESLCKE